MKSREVCRAAPGLAAIVRSEGRPCLDRHRTTAEAASLLSKRGSCEPIEASIPIGAVNAECNAPSAFAKPTARQADPALRRSSVTFHLSLFTFHKSLFPAARIWILFAQNYAKTFATGFSLECHSLAVSAVGNALPIASFFCSVDSWPTDCGPRNKRRVRFS